MEQKFIFFKERVRLPAETIRGYIKSMSQDKFVKRFAMRKRGYDKMLRLRFKGDVEKLAKFTEANPDHHYSWIKKNWGFSETMTGKLWFYKCLLVARIKQDEREKNQAESSARSGEVKPNSGIVVEKIKKPIAIKSMEITGDNSSFNRQALSVSRPVVIKKSI